MSPFMPTLIQVDGHSRYPTSRPTSYQQSDANGFEKEDTAYRCLAEHPDFCA
jgi:hypothetical protein